MELKEPIYMLNNVKDLMFHHLGRSVIAEEIQLAKITYYEGGELEEPREDELAA